MSNYLAKPKSTPKGGILVLHAWWGLNQFFKSFCDSLAKEGFVVLAPDLYNSAIAETIPDAEKLRKTSISKKHTLEQILNALKTLQSEVKRKPIGLIGFSMGAYWALSTVEEKPKAFSAVVTFYGARGGDYKKIAAPFMCHFADTDPYVSESGRKKLEKSLPSTSETFVYPNTGHWFFEKDRPEYNPQAAKQTWERTVKFLKENLA